MSITGSVAATVHHTQQLWECRDLLSRSARSLSARAHLRCRGAGVFYPPDAAGFEAIVATDQVGVWPGITFLLSVFFSLNLMMACLNMIPLPPLDGSAALLLGLGE